MSHILCFNCLVKHVIERKIEGRIEVVMGRRGRRRNHLLGELKEKREYFKVKSEAIVCTLWRICCGRGYGFVVRQTAGCMHVTWAYVNHQFLSHGEQSPGPIKNS